MQNKFALPHKCPNNSLIAKPSPTTAASDALKFFKCSQPSRGAPSSLSKIFNSSKNGLSITSKP